MQPKEVAFAKMDVVVAECVIGTSTGLCSYCRICFSDRTGRKMGNVCHFTE